MDFNVLFDFLKVITISSSLLEIALFVGFVIANNIFKRKIDSMFEKSVEKFKIEMQQYMTITFRDEEARSSIISNTIIGGDKIRIALYQKVYNMFFKLLFDQDKILKETDKAKQKSMIVEIHNEINSIRIDIFINSIRLGGLIDHLIPAQVGLWNDLGTIESKINGTWKGYQGEYTKSSEEIRNAEKWISKNMKPYLTLNHIDFSEDVINKLHDERSEIIKQVLK